MGKKVISQVPVKISKKHNDYNSNSEKKQQLNSLIKVLRPKVYITDSSSFKGLVQQLTGNGSSSEVPQFLPSPPSSSSSYSPQIVEKGPAVIDIEDDHGGNPASSMETSFDASVDESFHICSNHYLALTEDYQITEGSQFLPSPPPSYSSPQTVEKLAAVIDVEDDPWENPESSVETSFDASVDESFQVCCNHLALTEDYQINQAYVYDPFPLEDTNSTERDMLMNIINQQEVDGSFVYGDFESLLLDHIVDEQISYPSLNVYPQIQQEISIYDYELSALI